MLTNIIRRNRPRSEMTFMEHIDDLRVSMMRVFGVFFVGVCAALIFYKEIPKILQLPLDWAKVMDPEAMAQTATSGGVILFGVFEAPAWLISVLPAGTQLQETQFLGVWSVLIYAAVAAGIAVASPVFIYEVVRFVGPALSNREKKGLIPFCTCGLILFLLGAALAFFWLTPMSIVVVHHIAAGMGIRINWQASDYYGLVVMMSLLTGLCFQFPLALIILMWLELVRPRTLLKSWRGMLLGIVVVAVLITPIGDPLSLGVLTGALFALYLGAVAVGSWIVRRKRLARGDKPNPEDDDLPDEDDEEDSGEEDDGDRPRRPTGSGSTSSSSPESTAQDDKAADPKPSPAKSTPPPAEGDLSSLD
jgi:sec-independent protein translocase protein TatC